MSRGVKMIVIACNTSSAAALDILQQEYSVPVIGVIGAGARAACKRLNGTRIGVIATRATVKSGSYVKAIKQLCPAVEVLQRHATVLSPRTEG